MQTLRLEAVVAVLHDAQCGIALKVGCPHRNESQSSALDFVVCSLQPATWK
jgi:hypothetical protein